MELKEAKGSGIGEECGLCGKIGTKKEKFLSAKAVAISNTSRPTQLVLLKTVAEEKYVNVHNSIIYR